MLRKANISDFKIYKELYVNESFLYQWLYYSPGQVDLSKEREIDLEDDIFAYVIGEYKNYSMERFERDLKNCQIFMIEEHGELLGFVQTFYCGKGNYKLAEWGMFQDNDSVKRRVIEELKTKLPRLKKMIVCTTHKPARKFLMSAGFKTNGLSELFLELEVTGKG